MSGSPKDEALVRFRLGTDTREDRDLLRAWRIEYVSRPGGAIRMVPKVEEEDRPVPQPETMNRRAPKVWKP